MYFKKITINKRRSYCLCHGLSSIIEEDEVSEKYLYKKQLYARLYKKDNRILKVCYAQSIPKDNLRKYISRSQAQREFDSARHLSKIGLAAPQTHFCAFSLSPFKGLESMHEMSFLDGYQLLNKNICERQEASLIISLIADDLAKMMNNMICLKDFGLGNIMYHPSGHITWIDNDIKYFSDITKLTEYTMKLVKPRLLNYIDFENEKIFWKRFKKPLRPEQIRFYNC